MAARAPSVGLWPILSAGATALATLGLFAFVGYLSIRDLDFVPLGMNDQNSRSSVELFGLIVSRNVPLALLLFSGVATAALTTLLACMGLGAYLGATLTAAAHQAGTAAMFGSIAVYGPFELAGFLAAATAGLLPLAGVANLFLLAKPEMASEGAARSTTRVYLAAISPSLCLLAVAIVLLLLSAMLETIAITSRR